MSNRKILKTPPKAFYAPNRKALRNGEIAGADVVDHGTALRGQLAHMARNDSSIISHAMIAQRTLRLMKLIPTWSTFTANEFGSELFRSLDYNSLKRYRNWWELIFEITTPDQEQERVKLAIAYLVQRKLWLAYGKMKPVDPAEFGITDVELAAKIQTAAFRRYEALVPVD